MVCGGSFLLIFNPFSLILTPSYGMAVSAEYKCLFESALQIRNIFPDLDLDSTSVLLNITFLSRLLYAYG